MAMWSLFLNMMRQEDALAAYRKRYPVTGRRFLRPARILIMTTEAFLWKRFTALMGRMRKCTITGAAMKQVGSPGNITGRQTGRTQITATMRTVI